MSGTDDRRPELQRLLDMATAGGAPFDVVLVHSFSRFARDHFALEMDVRRLRKAGVRLVSITQDLGEDPMSVMVRQVFALFDEYQSKENAKHTLRAMQGNARQGFWNGSKRPYGYAVVAAEQRGAKTKKRLAIDPVEAEVIRLIFRLFREGDGMSGPMGVKTLTSWLNERGYRTRTGARWGIGPLHRHSGSDRCCRPSGRRYGQGDPVPPCREDDARSHSRRPPGSDNGESIGHQQDRIRRVAVHLAERVGEIVGGDPDNWVTMPSFFASACAAVQRIDIARSFWFHSSATVWTLGTASLRSCRRLAERSLATSDSPVT